MTEGDFDDVAKLNDKSSCVSTSMETTLAETGAEIVGVPKRNISQQKQKNFVITFVGLERAK